MTVTTLTLNIGNEKSLDAFDDVTHMAFGSDNTPTNSTQTTLGNELLRVVVTDITKDTVNHTYKFTGTIPITQLNSSTIYEIGLFNDSSSGEMSAKIVLTTGLTKTSDDELVFILIIQTNSINT